MLSLPLEKILWLHRDTVVKLFTLKKLSNWNCSTLHPCPMLASKNKQKVPNKAKTIPLQSTPFESSVHLNLIKTVLNPPPCNQGKNLKYARSHLSRLSILIHPLLLTDCPQCLGPYRGRVHITFVFLKAISQVTSMQRNANGLYDRIPQWQKSSPVLSHLNRKEEQETMDKNTLIYLPFPETYCVSGHSHTSTARISSKALLSKTHMKLHCQKNHSKGLWCSHSQTVAGLSFKSIWTDFEKNPSQNTIILIPLPTHPPLRENWDSWRLFLFDTFYLCSKYLHLHLSKKGKEEVKDILYL